MWALTWARAWALMRIVAAVAELTHRRLMKTAGRDRLVVVVRQLSTQQAEDYASSRPGVDSVHQMPCQLAGLNSLSHSRAGGCSDWCLTAGRLWPGQG